MISTRITLISLLWLLFWASSAVSASENINIEITSHLGDEKEFFQGDQINFLISMDKDAYLLLVYQTSQNQLIQLYPNRHMPNKKYKAGVYFQIPDDHTPYQFEITPPYGRETVWIFASSTSFPNYQGKELDNGMKLLGGKVKFTLKRIKNHAKQGPYGESFFKLLSQASP